MSYRKFKKTAQVYSDQDYVVSIYDFKSDENISNFYFDDDKEAMEFAKKIDLEPYQYVEMWKKDEEGTFGVSGSPLFKKERSR